MLDAIQIDPVAFTIPLGNGFDIYWYGIIVTAGILAGIWWASREIERRGQSVDDLLNAAILVIFSGYIFARLSYVFLDMIGGRQYTSLLDIINIRAGGVNILGGFIGAALVGTIYVKWRKLRFWHYADVAGPALLLAQAIGRWGNFINQELYGPPTTLPWGLLIAAEHRIAPYNNLTLYPAETRFHPTFLYESIALFIGFFLLAWLNKRYRDIWSPGTLFGVFLIWWGGNRAWIELFRPDQTTLGSTFITYSMLAAIGLALVGVYIVLARNQKLPENIKRKKQRVYKPKPRRESGG
ncbi:MAG: prolipoprotein diacylglyceryl transferase [Chloroflexi bacterium]|jgi:phosphatidylglycerol:prolipoprotein diacylglycerol transferase|nr:prolipoprotein diacylglyceryl transferase [Chloroflexota bacterium]MBK6711920.1 prolipoprotein diacylglyceryl transferase [Chloroflexota bacterium]MBK7178068.1 prolipoprotein diacylglyceryl transferase [Chloroflexota bacterium]MBP6802920.1 prolipoprotein diacylglyceryl transferase [Chloroflexota bacterium]MBP7589968.1 prolipoprotein diacylglyceryl transferase [Chloroflexota bacterium]